MSSCDFQVDLKTSYLWLPAMSLVYFTSDEFSTETYPYLCFHSKQLYRTDVGYIQTKKVRCSLG
jgi:hypothetical protein